MVLNEEVDIIFGDSQAIKTSARYLVCDNCKGYYKLKNNEYPEDFDICECGHPLKFVEGNDYLFKNPQIHEYYEEYEELEKIVDIIRTKAYERKKFLEKLAERIKTQEKILKEIKHERILEVRYNKWSLWDLLEKKGINNNIKDQKMLINDIVEQENKLMNYVKEKRNNKEIDVKITFNSYFTKIGIITVLITIIIILTIYTIK